MKWGLLFLLFMVSFGVINLNDAIAGRLGPVNIYGNDLVFIASILYAAFIYGAGREKPVFSPFASSPLSKAMLAYATLILYLILRDFVSTSSGWGSLQMLIRILPFYLLFFIVPAFVIWPEDLTRVIGVFVLTAGIGNVIIVAQSLHGPGNLFGNSFLGTIYTPPGPQISYYRYGDFWRSNFPVYFACVWLFFYYAARAVWSFRLYYLAAMGFFSLAFLLNFSRSLYAGIALASLVFFLVAIRRREALVKAALVIALFLAFILFVVPLLGFENLGMTVIERSLSALDDVQYVSGTWAGRLDHLTLYRQINPDIVEILLGYGYRGSQATLDMPFLEFGLIDPIYRGGILGAITLVGLMGTICYQAVYVARHSRTGLLFSIAVGTLCLITTEIGTLVGANHFLYQYTGSVITVAAAMLAIASMLDNEIVPMRPFVAMLDEMGLPQEQTGLDSAIPSFPWSRLDT